MVGVWDGVRGGFGLAVGFSWRRWWMRVLGAVLFVEGVGGRQGRRRARRVWMVGGVVGESIFIFENG